VDDRAFSAEGVSAVHPEIHILALHPAGNAASMPLEMLKNSECITNAPWEGFEQPQQAALVCHSVAGFKAAVLACMNAESLQQQGHSAEKATK